MRPFDFCFYSEDEYGYLNHKQIKAPLFSERKNFKGIIFDVLRNFDGQQTSKFQIQNLKNQVRNAHVMFLVSLARAQPVRPRTPLEISTAR